MPPDSKWRFLLQVISNYHNYFKFKLEQKGSYWQDSYSGDKVKKAI
jgi:hypothetical protein